MASIGWSGPRLTLAELLPGPAAEEDQEHRERQRREQRQVAERDEPMAAKSTSESAAISARPSSDGLRVAHEEQAVAQRIGPAEEHREADARSAGGPLPAAGGRRERLRRRQNSATRWKPARYSPPNSHTWFRNCVARADGERRLQRRDVAGGEERNGFRARPSRRLRGPRPLGEHLQVSGRAHGIGARRRARDRADVRQRAALAPDRQSGSGTAPPRRTGGRRVGETPASAGSSASALAHGIQIDDRVAPPISAASTRAEPAGAGQRDARATATSDAAISSGSGQARAASCHCCCRSRSAAVRVSDAHAACRSAGTGQRQLSRCRSCTCFEAALRLAQPLRGVADSRRLST